MENKNHIFVDNYGEMIAAINWMTLVSFETYWWYQWEYIAVCEYEDRLYYYMDYYGSCSWCDWLEDVWRSLDYDERNDKNYAVPFEEALKFVWDLKPKYIVPKEMPLQFESEEYRWFTLKK